MSRQFTVPILLPADPVNPLEAATKQYVDAKSAGAVDEVWVGAADPIVTNPTIELWYDSDATVNAAPGGLPYVVVPTTADLNAIVPYPGLKVYVQGTRTEWMWDSPRPTNDYFVFHGSAQEYIQTPDSAAVDLGVTGDIDISVRARTDSLTTLQMLAVKDNTSGQRSYSWYINSSGGLTLEAFPSSTAASTATLASAGLAPFTTYWWRAVLDVNNGAGGHSTFFYWAPDTGSNLIEPSTWNQLGATVTNAGTTPIANTTMPLYVGLRPNVLGNDYPFMGRIYRAIFRSTIGGAIVADMNAATPAANSGAWNSATTGESWSTPTGVMGPGWVIMSEPIQTFVPVVSGMTSPTVEGWYHRHDGFIDFFAKATTNGAVTGQIALFLPWNLVANRYEITVMLADISTNTYRGLAEDMNFTNQVNIYATFGASPTEAAGNTNASNPFTWTTGDYVRAKGNSIRMASRYAVPV